MATETDKVNTGALATIIVAGALFVAGVAAGVTALVRHQVDVVGDEVGAKASLDAVRKLKADQTAELAAAPGWEDKDQGTVDIPIDLAMKLVVGDISSNPEAATPPPVAPPSAADAGAPSAPDQSAKPAGGAKPAPRPANGAAKPPAPRPAPQPAPGGNAP